MKKFNGFKMAIMTLVIMPLALLGGVETREKARRRVETRVQKYMALGLGTAATAASWTGLYVGLKVSEKIADKLNRCYMAKFFEGVSDCAALPLQTGLGFAMFAIPVYITTYMIDEYITSIEKRMSEPTEKL